MSHVQGVFGTMGASSGVTSASATGSAVGSGNMVVGAVVLSHATTSNLSSVTDNKGNTYNIRQSLKNGGTVWLITFDLAYVTGGPTIITANFGAGGVGFPQVLWDEYSLVNGTDGNAIQVVVTNAAGTDNISSGSVTPTLANDTMWGVVINSNAFTNLTAGTGFTLREQDNNVSDWGISSEDEALSSAAAVAATFSTSTSTSQGWIVAGVLLKLVPEWGDELRGQQARRLPWRSKILDPNEFINNPTQFPAPPWVHDPDYFPRLRPSWRARPQSLYEEFINNPTQFSLGPLIEEELHFIAKRTQWRAHPQPNDIEGLPFTSVTAVFKEWADELRGIQIRRPWNAWPRPGNTRDDLADIIGGTPLPAPPGPPPPIPGGVNRAGVSVVGGLPQNIPVNIPTDPLQVVMAFSGLVGAINQWIGQAAPQIANPALQVYTMATLPGSAKPGTLVLVVDAPPGQRLRIFWGGIWNLV